MPNEHRSDIRTALRAAFPHTLPIFAGFWFLGMAYGVYMDASGFSAWYPILMSIVIFGGSLEFVAVSLLLSPFAPLSVLGITLMIQGRHLFYGLSMLEKYKGTGWKKPYLIYALCDESFSINCSVRIPDGVDRGWFMFFVSLLNQSYWVTGTAAGALLGNFIPFSTEGLDFVVAAMFAVIFLEQWMKERKHWTALIGTLSSLACLLVFGKDSFLTPSMACILVLLTAFRRPLEREGGFA
ncbi:MAG: AzlC family ABC transporter permease [Mailhella sp.]|nr:AzlC family ABC transporter permease [Mailhella sp.]